MRQFAQNVGGVRCDTMPTGVVISDVRVVDTRTLGERKTVYSEMHPPPNSGLTSENKRELLSG